MTWASISRARSQRASQKPSRPASKAIAIRSTLCPAFSASSRQRLSSFSNALSSTASFFNGERSTPGTIPATSQLDWPISITAISVASCSRITRDLLKSFSCGMGRSVDSLERRWCHCPRRSPHSIYRARATVELGTAIGWDDAHAVLYAGALDIAVGPRWYSTYEMACNCVTHYLEEQKISAIPYAGTTARELALLG